MDARCGRSVAAPVNEERASEFATNVIADGLRANLCSLTLCRASVGHPLHDGDGDGGQQQHMDKAAFTD